MDTNEAKRCSKRGESANFDLRYEEKIQLQTSYQAQRLGI